MKTIITLQQAQLAFDGGMDELAYYLFMLACKQLEANQTINAELLIAEHLTPECVRAFVEYAEALASDPVEYAAYCAVTSIFIPM